MADTFSFEDAQQPLAKPVAATAPATFSFEEALAPPKPGLLEDIGHAVRSTGEKVGAEWLKGAQALADTFPSLKDEGLATPAGPQDMRSVDQISADLNRDALKNAPQTIPGQVAGALTYAPFGAAAPLVMGGAEGLARKQALLDQGVDEATANKAGLAEGALMGGIGMLPLGNFVVGQGAKVLAKSAASATAKAAAVGAGQSVASDAATQAYLDANGYDEQAKQFAPSVAKAAEGALFMGAFHGGMQGAHLAAGKVVDAAAGRLAPPEVPVPDAAPGASVADQLRAHILPEYAAEVGARADLHAQKEASIAAAKAADPMATADAVLSAPTLDDAVRAADALINAPLPGERAIDRAPDADLATALHAVDGMGRGTSDADVGVASAGSASAGTRPDGERGPTDPAAVPADAAADLPAADRPVDADPALVEPAASTERTGNPMLDNPASWIIRNKETGDVVMETYDRKKVDALNTEKYEAVPAYQHLTELNDPNSLAYKVARGEAPGEDRAAQRTQLAGIANRLGIGVSESDAGFHAADSMVHIPSEDAYAEGSSTPEQIFAHELGHAIMQKRGVDFKGFPKEEILRYISNYDELVQASKDYRPEVHDHTSTKVRAHARKPNEILADAIGSVLIGKQPVSLLEPLMSKLGWTPRDLGLGEMSPNDAAVAISAPAKIAPLDHGELNIPGRLNGINAELDRYKATQEKQAKTDAKTRSVQNKADKARAKELFAEVGDALLDKHGEKFGRKKLANELDQMVKWEPAKFIGLAEKFKAEKAAQSAPATAPDGEHFDRAAGEQARNQALNRAVDVALRRADGLETEPIARTSAVLKLRQAFNRLESGKDADPDVAHERFRNTVESLLNRLEEKTATKQATRDVAERQRGADFLREKLLMAKRRGDITPETADMADWFVRQNPALVDELGLSVKSFKGDGQAPAGAYNPLARVMTLFKGAANDTTAVHEILHHFERLMPKDMQAAIRTEYVERIGKLLEAKDAPPAAKEYLHAALEGYASGDAKAMQRAQELLGKAPDGFYQYFNPSEFWAVNATRLLERRYEAQDSVWARIGDWLKNAVQHVKGALGMASDAPVLRALDRVLEGDSGKIARDAKMLSEGRSLHDETERDPSFYEGKTVEVDGQRRPITNAKGQLVAPDTAGQIAFWKWFSGSKAVDEQGRPLAVYHGTKSDFKEFDIKKFGGSDEGLAGKGFYFTYNPEEASGYAMNEQFGSGDAPNVQSVYVAVRNPLIIKGGVLPDGRKVSDLHQGIGINAKGGEAVRKLADEGGHDGVMWMRPDGGAGHVVAFRPEQIKSATGNRGTFDAENPNILYDRTKPDTKDRETVDPEQDAAPPEVTPADQSRLAKMVGVPKEMLHSAASSMRQLVMPITDGSMHAMAWAKDFASRGRKADAQWRAFDRILEKNYTKDQLEKMWLAADQENDLRREGRTSDTEGLNSLTAGERDTVELLNQYGQVLWNKAKAAGLVEGDGVAYWTPRVAARIHADGTVETLRGANPGEPSKDARNLRTSASSIKQRQHDTLAESEAALKAKFGDDAGYVKNIRVMPKAMAELERAIAGRTLVNQIKAHGQVLGEDLFSDTGAKNFVLIDHPALKRWQPKIDWLPTDMEKLATKGLEVKKDGVYKDGEQLASYRIKDGQVEQRRAVLDETGKPVMTSSPLYVRKDFAGPLKAVFTTEANKVYRGYMELKGLSMSMIMISPATHNMVVWGKVIPSLVSAMGWQANLKNLATGGVYSYVIGHRARADHALMNTLIEGNLAVMGGRGMNPDLPTIANGIEPGNSLLAKGLGKAGDLAGKNVGDTLRTGVDKFGHFWHETLLWNRVGDVQIGIALQLRKHLLDKGVDDYTATRIATHFANQYVGSIPREALSQGAHMVGNVALFSKSFTLTNLGAMKATVAGLPKEIQAQIQLHAFELNRAMGKSEVEAVDAAGNVVKQAQGIARRKAQAVLLVDMVAFTFAASALQSALQGNQFVDDLKERVGRLGVKLDADNPLSFLGPQIGKTGLPLAFVRHPLDNLASLSQTSDNPHDKEDRVRLGEDPDGNTWYMRLPVGKFAEELKAYLNPSSALHLLHNKLSPVVKALVEIADNEDFNGRRVRIPTDDAFKQAASMAGHIVKAQVPFDDAVALKHVLAGDTDNQKVPLAGHQLSMDQAKLLGTATGLTVGKLAGGDAVAELRYANREQQAKLHDVLPDVREAMRRGDSDGAYDLLEQAGQSPRDIHSLLRQIEQPDRLSKSALKKFNAHADDDQRERMDRLRK